MILKNISKLCKKHGALQLWDGEDEQWLGAYGAIYSMAGAPQLDGDSAAFLLDLTEKDLEKIMVTYRHYPPAGVDLSDVSEDERAVELPSSRIYHGGKELLFVPTSEGITIFDPEYLTPLRDIREGLEWYERKDERGLVYLVAASGWVPRAAIMPLDVRGYRELPGKLEALASGLRRSLARAEEKDGAGEAEEQTGIDMETGEVLT